jgi:hypothetical protein
MIVDSIPFAQAPPSKTILQFKVSSNMVCCQ